MIIKFVFMQMILFYTLLPLFNLPCRNYSSPSTHCKIGYCEMQIENEDNMFTVLGILRYSNLLYISPLGLL